MQYNPLHDVLILLVVSVVAIAIFRRVNLPAILGYLFVGIIVGPHALTLVTDSEVTKLLGEIGLAFLLFTIGLHFSINQFLSLRRILLGLGSAQVIVGTVSGAIIAWLAGIPWHTAVVVGGALSMSSTAIVTKQLADQFELQLEHGRLSLGILLFQDLAAVPFLAMIPLLADSTTEFIAGPFFAALLKGALVLGVMLIVGRTILRPLFREITRTYAPELFTLTVLLVTLAAAWITHLLGLSFALGTFLAGMMLSETEFKHQIETEIRPFRDVLLGLFFITVGMQLNLFSLLSSWPWIVLLVFGLIFGKGLLIAILAYLGGYSRVMALRTGVVMGHGGEFGIALLTLAVYQGLLDSSNNQPILSAIILSMAAAPLLIRFNQWIAARVILNGEQLTARESITEISHATQDLHDHIIICGFGDTGRNLTIPVSEEGFAYIGLDIDPIRVKSAWENDEPVFYGDVTHPGVLEAAGLSRAKVLVVTLDSNDQIRKVVDIASTRYPNLPILVRAHNDDELELLIDKGATDGVPETFETSQMLAIQLLLLLQVPIDTVSKRIKATRGSHYRFLEGYLHTAELRGLAPMEKLHHNLRSLIVPAGAYAEGRQLADLNLERFGVLVTTVRHSSNQHQKNADPQTILTGDVLILHGTLEQLRNAEDFILTGKQERTP